MRGMATALTPALLARVRERAPGYDAANGFFTEDLDELRAAGYLAPRSLSAASADQRLLAAHAPATALGLTMHHVWMGVARDLAAAGDPSLQWVLDDGERGELFAFAISEAGNDRVMSDSLTRVERVSLDGDGDGGAGGWAFTGTKIFTTLSPAWTRLGVLGRHDPADGSACKPYPKTVPVAGECACLSDSSYPTGVSAGPALASLLVEEREE